MMKLMNDLDEVAVVLASHRHNRTDNLQDECVVDQFD
jgi:hypothetical protein